MNFPILSTIIFLPLLGSLFVFISKSNNNQSAIYVSLFTSFANFLLSLFLWYSFDKTDAGFQFIEESNWISGLIKFRLVSNFWLQPRNSYVSPSRACSNLSVNRDIPETIVTASINEINIEVK